MVARQVLQIIIKPFDIDCICIYRARGCDNDGSSVPSFHLAHLQHPSPNNVANVLRLVKFVARKALSHNIEPF